MRRTSLRCCPATTTPRSDCVPARRLTADDLDELQADSRRCAERAGLVYVEGQSTGITRRRRGRGFSYARGSSAVSDPSTVARIAELAIPPAWRSVWISPDPSGHLLATGLDDAGRKQYMYHPAWREQRDIINFYRLIVVARALPAVRAHVSAQLRRRSLDRARVLAGMIALLDGTLIRVGNEVYADENESIGLCTLGVEHVSITSRRAVLVFPAKSGKTAEITVTSSALLRLLRELSAAADGSRLFTVDGHSIDPDEINATLSAVSSEHVTAKDFRTWGGTTRAFSVLRPFASSGPVSPDVILAAVDAAAAGLSNTRSVARAHYVHPHVLECFADGSATSLMRSARPVRAVGLSTDERKLAGLLDVLFAKKFGA
jgi:DNA topoisomerase-1